MLGYTLNLVEKTSKLNSVVFTKAIKRRARKTKVNNRKLNIYVRKRSNNTTMKERKQQKNGQIVCY